MDARTPAKVTALPTGALREAWTRNRDLREAALGLGVIEAALLGSTCGQGVTRLVPDWRALAASLPELGLVTASTRSARAAVQRRGTYPGAPGSVTVLPIEPIDVHVSARAMHSVFAVDDATRPSIRLFDARGARVHVITLDRESRRSAFDALVARHASPDQAAEAPLDRAAPPVVPAPGAAGVVRARWEALGGPDDVAALCAALGLTRHEGLRAAPPGWVWPVSRRSIGQVLRWVAAEAIPVKVSVGNATVRQSRSGHLHLVEHRGRTLVARAPDFALHLRADRVASAWVVSMPGGRTRVATALELLDERGAPIVRIAGAEDRRELDAQSWWAALGRLPVVPRS